MSPLFTASAKPEKSPVMILVPRKEELKDFTPPENTVIIFKTGATFNEETIIEHKNRILTSYMLANNISDVTLLLDSAKCQGFSVPSPTENLTYHTLHNVQARPPFIDYNNNILYGDNYRLSLKSGHGHTDTDSRTRNFDYLKSGHGPKKSKLNSGHGLVDNLLKSGHGSVLAKLRTRTKFQKWPINNH